MPAKMTADYSAFPDSIREAMPYVEGEVVELRHLWGLFHHLFVDDKKRLRLLSKYLGPFLAVFQQLLENQLVLVISRPTDSASTGR